MRYLIGDAIARHYPQESAAFVAARQQRGATFDALNAVQVPLLLLASAALPVLLVIAWRRRDPDAVLLLGILTLALLGNAFVCGALSNPNDRYQSRIAWLAIVAIAIALGRWHRQSGPGRPSPASDFPRRGGS
jgi:cytochrome c biogenesis factor